MVSLDQARRYAFYTRWLIVRMTRQRRVHAAAAVGFGALAKLSAFGAFIGTFHMIAMLVMQRLKDASGGIPFLSEISATFTLSSAVSAALLVITLLYTFAIGAYVVSARITRNYLQRVRDDLTDQIFRNRVHNLARRAPAEPKKMQKAFRQIVNREIPYYEKRVGTLAGIVENIGETAVTLAVLLSVLAYVVPTLAGLILGVGCVFVFFVATVIYRKEKRTEEERRTRVNDARADQEQLLGDFEAALRTDAPDRFLDKKNALDSRHRAQAADQSRKKVDEMRNILQQLLMFVVFVVILFYINEKIDSAEMPNEIDIIYIVVLVLATRFTLIHFRALITQWFNFNSQFRNLQELYKAAHGSAKAAEG